MKINVVRQTSINFTSYEHREYMLEQLRQQQQQEYKRALELERQLRKQREERRRIEELRKAEERRRQEEQRRIEEEKRIKQEIKTLNQNIEECSKYRGLSEPLCDNMAAFMLNFSCSMMMESEHDLREFFGTDEEAESVRNKLTPECKKLSVEMRSELMKTKMSEDPLFGLITVNRLKDYMPDEGILSDEQYNGIADNTKFACTTLIKKGNYDDFDDDDKATIGELVEIVETTPGLNFGEEFEEKLSALVDKANKKEKTKLNESPYTSTFIPPVEVRYLDEEREIERERELER